MVDINRLYRYGIFVPCRTSPSFYMPHGHCSKEIRHTTVDPLNVPERSETRNTHALAQFQHPIQKSYLKVFIHSEKLPVCRTPYFPFPLKILHFLFIQSTNQITLSNFPLLPPFLFLLILGLCYVSWGCYPNKIIVTLISVRNAQLTL